MKSAALLLTVITMAISSAQPISGKIYNLLVGTYTEPGKSQGIYVFSFDTETGEFKSKNEVSGINNPSFLTVSHNRKFVYAVSEGREGMVNAYSFDPASGKLAFINGVSSGGADPCYVSVDNSNKFVFVGNYSGGSVSAIPIKPDGSLSSTIQNIKHEGKSIKPNQEKSHVHAAALSHDNKILFTPDLGTDKVNIYTIDVSKSNPLAPADPPFAPITIGGGPRHIAFHPNSKYTYVIHENTGDITVFEATKGNLKEKQKVSMAATGYTGDIHAADIHISPDGKFLYGSMRAEINELGIYSIDHDGKLKWIGRQSTLGKIPRNFAIDPSGNFLLVGNQNSDEIVIFKRDKNSGLLTATGKRIPVGKPVCLKFTSID